MVPFRGVINHARTNYALEEERRVGRGMKAFSAAWGWAGRILALRAQKDMTPLGEALWKQQRSMRLMSMSLSSMKGLTKRVSVLRLVQNEGSVPIWGQRVFISLRLPPMLVMICKKWRRALARACSSVI